MFRPKCVAIQEASSADEQFPRDLQWSADGTCLIVTLSNNSIQTIVVPFDLLEEAAEPRLLSTYCTIKERESVKATVGCPFFRLQDPSTTLVLSSLKEHPIRLSSALNGHLVASYPLVNPMTEEVISPHSLLFTSQGDRFMAGSESQISTFDVSRPGEGPIFSMPTGPRKRGSVDFSGAVHMRGIVSAMTVDGQSGLLAAGTYSRFVGLYDSQGQGDCIGVFSVKGTAADKQIGGGGVTQLRWSPCGRYLYIAERRSDGVMLYDIRQTGQLLSWLQDRNARTNQRLQVDVVASGDSGNQEVWAGGLDGSFRMWENPHNCENSVAPTFEFKGHDDVVSGAVVHRCGGVIATASGQRHFSSEALDETGSRNMDSKLKIWRL